MTRLKCPASEPMAAGSVASPEDSTVRRLHRPLSAWSPDVSTARRLAVGGARRATSRDGRLVGSLGACAVLLGRRRVACIARGTAFGTLGALGLGTLLALDGLDRLRHFLDARRQHLGDQLI